MIAAEFNKIDDTFLRLEQNTISKIKEDNICINEYRSTFLRLLKVVVFFKNKKEIFSQISVKEFGDICEIKALLNKKNIGSFKFEKECINDELNVAEKNLFQYLDKIKDPYFYILNPIYSFGAGIDYNSYFSKRFGYKKIEITGIKNLDIAVRYCLYKLQKK